MVGSSILATGLVGMSYYYACSYPLGQGSIVRRGNWGRIFRMDNIGSNPAGFVREIVFEQIRLQYYPDRPSRFDCNFLCPTLESAVCFLKESGRRRDLLYEVELTDQNASRFETNWFLIKDPSNLTLDGVEMLAHAYWSPQTVPPQHRERLHMDEPEYRELLVMSDIRIVGQPAFGNPIVRPDQPST